MIKLEEDKIELRENMSMYMDAAGCPFTFLAV